MLLNQTAEYALRAMAWIRACGDEQPVSSQAIAEATGIPRHYVSKVMRRLVLAELVISRRGHGGGFVLARPAEQIRFVDIIDAADGLGQERRCAFGLGACSPEEPCMLHPAWSELTEVFLRWARSTTLDTVDEGWSIEGRMRRGGDGGLL